MLNNRNNFIKCVRHIPYCLCIEFPGQDGKDNEKNQNPKLGSAPAVLWREPVDIKSRDLFYGQGGPEHQPNGKLTFIEEKFNGVNPKFDVRDEAGIRWGVKMGNEAKPETAATRLDLGSGVFHQ